MIIVADILEDFRGVRVLRIGLFAARATVDAVVDFDTDDIFWSTRRGFTKSCSMPFERFEGDE